MLKCTIIQDNFVKTINKNVIRGLHYQTNKMQDKLIKIYFNKEISSSISTNQDQQLIDASGSINKNDHDGMTKKNYNLFYCFIYLLASFKTVSYTHLTLPTSDLV